MTPVVLAVDVGTSSTQACVVDMAGRVVRHANRSHSPVSPEPGQFEMDAAVWWLEFASLSRELLGPGDVEVQAVGVSGMGPCVLIADESDKPLRPAILYGVDTRATEQIRRLESQLGADEILHRCGSGLSSQAVGPKLLWLADNEPESFARARRMYMPSSWLVRQLTGAYVLDHHSASQCTPMYDVNQQRWDVQWASAIAPGIDLPPLRWAGEAAGEVTPEAARQTGLPRGIPVITGTIDAWAEAVSVDASHPGDLMLMYGTTMFLVHTRQAPLPDHRLWGTVGVKPGDYCVAGGMATSGSIVTWLQRITGASDLNEIFEEARHVPPGANGLLLLPYFAGERSPIMDPLARGVIAGLTTAHSRADLLCAVIEATGYAVRHNIDTMRAVGSSISRVVAVGGGTRQRAWVQTVSDITGCPQELRTTSFGASYGGAVLAAQLELTVDIDQWNPLVDVVTPAIHPAYEAGYPLYRDLYESTTAITHALAARQQLAHSEEP